MQLETDHAWIDPWKKHFNFLRVRLEAEELKKEGEIKRKREREREIGGKRHCAFVDAVLFLLPSNEKRSVVCRETIS